jgi:hypothetical protein
LYITLLKDCSPLASHPLCMCVCMSAVIAVHPCHWFWYAALDSNALNAKTLTIPETPTQHILSHYSPLTNINAPNATHHHLVLLLLLLLSCVMIVKGAYLQSSLLWVAGFLFIAAFQK